jgi:hypothetical protein
MLTLHIDLPVIITITVYTTYRSPVIVTITVSNVTVIVTITGDLYVVLTVIVKITGISICSANSYCDNNGEIYM